MEHLDFERSLELRQTSEDTYENIHEPWTWHGHTVVPGGLLISECAAAAYKTIGDGFVLDILHAQFLAGPTSKPPIQYQVTKLSNGRRFAVRLVVASQNGKNILTATISFVSKSAESKHAMKHSVSRETSQVIDKIDLDDLVPKTPLGPFMCFQRLLVHHTDTEKNPQSGVTVSAAQISPPLSHESGHMYHILGVLNLSDYHVLDAPMQLSDITFGLHALNDYDRTLTERQPKMMTSLNHTVHIHKSDGYRADDLLYIEAKSPWAEDGRVLVQTRIFTGDGTLIASCVQEAYIVLKDEVEISKL